MLYYGEMDIGTLWFSRAAKERLNHDDVLDALERYKRCDWGNAPSRYHERNRYTVVEGGQVVGLYEDRNGTAFWVITQPKHLDTNIKLADESWEER